MLKIKRARPKAMFMGPVTLARCDNITIRSR